MPANLSFGRLVRERRRALDLTQEELARRVGCAAITIRKIEADDLRPSQQIAERLAMALGIPLDDRAEFVRQARVARPEPEPAAHHTPSPALEEIGREDLTGRAIRGYALAEKIGAGGMGAVYRAVQPVVEREVAIKIILPAFANHPDFIRRFESEAQLVARLEHPHIIPLYDYWREPGVAYLVMRLLRGGSMQTQLQQGPLPIETVTRALEQICAALHAAHRIGVIHRDLKPANVLLDEDNNAYLADFGIAKNLGNPNLEEQTQVDAIIGSPQYMSPEQIRSLTVRPQTDIYGLGVMLYEMLTGALPFTGPTPFDMFQQHMAAPLPPLSAHRTGLPAALDAVIGRAAAKDPDERYPDTLSLLDDFRRAADRGGLETRGLNLQASDSPILSSDENPYKGLRAFAEADADDFFGRETLTQQLLARLAEGGELSRFLAVVGPSGSGKSSVVKAGLLPALRRGGLPGSDQWFTVDFLPGAHPFEELEAALLRVAVNPPASLLEQLKSDPRGLLRAVQRILPADHAVELVLVIDQFEELFTLTHDEAERALFLHSLVTAVMDERSRARVVITLRADFIDHPLRYVDFGELLQRRNELVLPLTPDEVERAIVGPARRVRLTLESGLASMMMREVGDQPGALPLLQYALTELFEKRDGNVLTKHAYDEIGGVLGALGKRAEDVHARLNESEQALARQLFLRLITLGEGAEDTRRRVLRRELESLDAKSQISHQPSAISHVTELFGRSRLLSFDRDPVTRGPTVEVAHEALLREWPRLREWLRESRADVRWQRQLAQAAHEWHEAKQDVSFLLTGARLEQFESWALNTSVALTQEEGAFLEASITERDRSVTEEHARQRRELETAHKLAETEKAKAESERRDAMRLRARNRVIAAAGVVALVLALLAGVFGVQSNQNAIIAQHSLSTAQVANTQSAANAAQAQANLGAAQAANELANIRLDTAVNAQATAQAQGLIAEANFTRAEAQRLAAEALNALNANASAETVALLSIRALNWQYSPQGDAALLSAAQLDYPVRLHTRPSPLFGLEVSPDGQTLLTIGEAGRALLLLDVQTGETLRRFEHPADVLRAIFSPDGLSVLSDGDDNRQRVWDSGTGHQIQEFLAAGRLSSGVFADDGATIYAGTADGLVQSWSLATGQEQQRWQLAGRVMDIAPQPQWALTSDAETLNPQLWDLVSRQLLHTFASASTKSDVQFCSGGALVVVGYFDGAAMVWDSASGAILRRLEGHKGAVRNIECSPDGRWLLTGGDDRTARLWDAETGQEIRRFREQAIVSYIALADNRQHVLTLSGDGAGNALRVWETQPKAAQAILAGHQGVMSGVAFSPDGRWLAASDEISLQVWDAASQQLIQAFALEDVVNYGLEFSPDGRYLASGQWHHGVVELWDVTRGELIRRLTAAEVDGINDLAFSPDGHYLFGGAGTWSPTAHAAMWEVQTGAVVFTIPLADTSDFYGADYSPDGATVATAHTDGKVRLWDAHTGALLTTLDDGQNSLLLSVRFSPNGQWLATAGNDRLVHLWDVQTGQAVRQFAGHTDLISHLAFSPDGMYVATASYDHTARLWAVASGAEVRRYVGHLSGVENVAFAPNGKSLASVGDDGTARLWEVDYHATVQYLCFRLLRDFTDDERKQYSIPNDGPTCLKP